jgi:peroxiredoxin
MKHSLLPAALALSLALAPGLRAAAMGNPAVGKAAPGFSVAGSDGKTYDLAKLKGKTVVLEWTNPGCPFVHKHYDSGNMQSLQKKYTGKGVVWLSVASSGEGSEGFMASNADAQAWLKEQKASPTALLRDPEGSLGHLYGAKTTPHMFVINKKGLLVYKGAIDDKPSPNPEDIASAHNWVAAALDSVLQGKPVEVGETRSYGCGVKYKD